MLAVLATHKIPYILAALDLDVVSVQFYYYFAHGFSFLIILLPHIGQ
jgi:hypothetical protein